MSLDRVNAYVKEKGFDRAEKTGRGKAYTVYTPFFEKKDGMAVPTGLPVLILEKNGHLIWITGRKVFMICDDMFRKAMEPKNSYA